MQIHEVTALNENFLARMTKQARDDAFKKATGVDWNTRNLAQTTTPPASAPAATPAAAPKPAATTVTPAGFDASNVLNLPGMKQAATVTQSPEQIRKAKQALAAQTARDQMAGKTTAAQPVATVPSAAAPTEKPGFLKTATDKISDRNKTQAPPATSTAPAAAPVVYRFDGRALNPQNTRDSAIIAQLQAAGVTSATSGIKKTK